MQGSCAAVDHDLRQEDGFWYMNLDNDPTNNKRVKN